MGADENCSFVVRNPGVYWSLHKGTSTCWSQLVSSRPVLGQGENFFSPAWSFVVFVRCRTSGAAPQHRAPACIRARVDPGSPGMPLSLTQHRCLGLKQLSISHQCDQIRDWSLIMFCAARVHVLGWICWIPWFSVQTARAVSGWVCRANAALFAILFWTFPPCWKLRLVRTLSCQLGEVMLVVWAEGVWTAYCFGDLTQASCGSFSWCTRASTCLVSRSCLVFRRPTCWWCFRRPTEWTMTFCWNLLNFRVWVEELQFPQGVFEFPCGDTRTTYAIDWGEELGAMFSCLPVSFGRSVDEIFQHVTSLERNPFRSCGRNCLRFLLCGPYCGAETVVLVKPYLWHILEFFNNSTTHNHRLYRLCICCLKSGLSCGVFSVQHDICLLEHALKFIVTQISVASFQACTAKPGEFRHVFAGTSVQHKLLPFCSCFPGGTTQRALFDLDSKLWWSYAKRQSRLVDGLFWFALSPVRLGDWPCLIFSPVPWLKLEAWSSVWREGFGGSLCFGAVWKSLRLVFSAKMIGCKSKHLYEWMVLPRWNSAKKLCNWRLEVCDFGLPFDTRLTPSLPQNS